jgi:hypothetical protein
LEYDNYTVACDYLTKSYSMQAFFVAIANAFARLEVLVNWKIISAVFE